MKRFLLLFVFLLSLAAGIAEPFVIRHLINSRAEADKLIVINLSETTQASEPAWEREIQKRFPGAVVVFSHGGDNEEGEWCLCPDSVAVVDGQARREHGDRIRVKDKVLEIQRWYPGRWVVVIACNPEHHFLHGVHHVVYADRNVWIDPDAYSPAARAIVAPDEAAGNINQFIVAE